MTCDEFLESAAGWLEGDQPAPLQSHLSVCERCRSVIDDLATISQAGRLLGDAAAEPPQELWTRLRAQLEAEGLIHDLPPTAERGPRLALVHQRLRVLAFAAVPILVAAVFLVVFSTVKRPGTVRFAQGSAPSLSSIEDHLAMLERQVGSANAAGDAAAVGSLRQGLSILDGIIHDCKAELRTNPNNNIAQGFLFDAYREKAWILQTISERDMNAP